MQRFYIGSTYYSVTMQQCWINIFVHHAKTASSSAASFFTWQRRARSEWLEMNRKGPRERYRRQAKRRLKATSRPLSPSRLPLRARFKERRLGTRQMQQCWSNMLAKHDATILRWTNMLVQHYATMSDTLGQHGESVIRDLSEISRGGWGVGILNLG